MFIADSVFGVSFFCEFYGFTPLIKEINGFSNVLAKPDFSTILKIDWLEKTVGILGDIYDEEMGELVKLGPRSLLQMVIN